MNLSTRFEQASHDGPLTKPAMLWTAEVTTDLAKRNKNIGYWLSKTQEIRIWASTLR